LLLALLLANPVPAAAICPGECSGDGSVSVDELVTCVEKALGTAAPTQCTACDPVADGRVGVDELIAATQASLYGCPSPTFTPTATPLRTGPQTRGTPGRVMPPAPTPTPPPASGCSPDGPRPCLQRAPATVGPCSAVALTGNEVTASTVGGTNTLGNGEELNCGNNGGGSDALERVYIFTPPAPGRYEITVQGDKFRPLLHLRRQSCQGEFIDCAYDTTTSRRVTYELTVTAPVQPVAIGVDGDGSKEKGMFTLTITPLLPDLVVESLSVPQQATGGEEVTVSALIRNQGNADADVPFVVELVYARDAALTQTLGSTAVTCSFDRLEAGDSRLCEPARPLPVPLVAPGAYFIGARVDVSSKVFEGPPQSAGESNNRAAAASSIAARGVEIVQQLFRAADGTSYQLVYARPTLADTLEDHFRLTSVAAAVGAAGGCIVVGGGPGATVEAISGVPIDSTLRSASAVQRTTLLEPNETLVSFDSDGRGRLQLGSGGAARQICRDASDCVGRTPEPLVSIETSDGAVADACVAQIGSLAACESAPVQRTLFAFGVPASAPPRLCTADPTTATTVCAPEPGDGVRLSAGQALVFVHDGVGDFQGFNAAVAGFAVGTLTNVLLPAFSCTGVVNAFILQTGVPGAPRPALPISPTQVTGTPSRGATETATPTVVATATGTGTQPTATPLPATVTPSMTATATRTGTVAATPTRTATVATPANDTCAAASLVGALPFTSMVNTTTATSSAGDPAPSCGNNSTARNVWYRIPSSPSQRTVQIDSGGYDTILSFYSGACGALVNFACNDDVMPGVVASRLNLLLAANTTFFVQVSSYQGTGGNLTVSIQ
jgi:hypothetical protein